jgi:hypothetical protein
VDVTRAGLGNDMNGITGWFGNTSGDLFGSNGVGVCFRARILCSAPHVCYKCLYNGTNATASRRCYTRSPADRNPFAHGSANSNSLRVAGLAALSSEMSKAPSPGQSGPDFPRRHS